MIQTKKPRGTKKFPALKYAAGGIDCKLSDSFLAPDYCHVKHLPQPCETTKKRTDEVDS